MALLDCCRGPRYPFLNSKQLMIIFQVGTCSHSLLSSAALQASQYMTGQQNT